MKADAEPYEILEGIDAMIERMVSDIAEGVSIRL